MSGTLWTSLALSCVSDCLHGCCLIKKVYTIAIVQHTECAQVLQSTTFKISEHKHTTIYLLNPHLISVPINSRTIQICACRPYVNSPHYVSEQYEEAVKDLSKCLEIQKEHLNADNRLLAETHYQLGLAFSFNKQFKEATDNFNAAIKVIEDRVANLNKVRQFLKCFFFIFYTLTVEV